MLSLLSVDIGVYLRSSAANLFLVIWNFKHG